MLVFATADLAILCTAIVLAIVFFPTVIMTFRWIRGIPSRIWGGLVGCYASIRDWNTERLLRREKVRAAAAQVALIEEQLRNEQVRTFMNEKIKRGGDDDEST